MGRSAVAVAPEERERLMGEALALMDQGMSLREIEAELGVQGVNYQRIREWLLGEVPEKYREAQARGLIRRIVECDGELDASRSMLEVNKNAHACRFARWDAERRLSRLFAVKSEVSGPGGGPIQLDLSETARRLAFLMAQGATVEGTASRVEDDPADGAGDDPAAV
jgi:hypothetical protein